MKKLTWTTTSEYVDVETGEILTMRQVKENYIILRKNTITKINKDHYGTATIIYGRITITNECRRSTQGKLF